MVEEIIDGVPVFNQPAGHLEINETLTAAAQREVLEETGWTVKITHWIGVYRWCQPETGVTWLRFVLGAEPLEQDLDLELDAPVIATHWMSPEELEQERHRFRSPLVGAAIRDARSGRRLPLEAIAEVTS